jgi:multiple sugar transport system permease protein
MAARALQWIRPRQRAFDATERSLISPLEARQPGGRILYWLVFTILLALVLSTLFPLYWLFSGGLKPTTEFFRRPPTLIPEQVQWDNYQTAWERLNYVRYFGNTIAIAFGDWAFQLFVTATAAFSLSKLRPAFGNVLLFMFFSTVMVPGAILLIPRYLTVVSLPIIDVSLLNTWWAIWLPGAVNGFGIFLLKVFFDSVPDDLTDAARLDGASAWRMFTEIVLPLSKSAIIVLTISTLIASWQEFFWPFLVLAGAPDRQPIMVALYRLGGTISSGIPLNVVIAGTAIAAIPPMVIFFIFQRHIIRGINLTGLQG